jgi:hypothetical protein
MLPLEPQPLDYRTVTPIVASPQLWVLCLLVFIQFVGVIGGRMIWSAIWPGKDPQVEFAWANGGGFALFAVLCFLCSKRLSRGHSKRDGSELNADPASDSEPSRLSSLLESKKRRMDPLVWGG